MDSVMENAIKYILNPDIGTAFVDRLRDIANSGQRDFISGHRAHPYMGQRQQARRSRDQFQNFMRTPVQEPFGGGPVAAARVADIVAASRAAAVSLVTKMLSNLNASYPHLNLSSFFTLNQPVEQCADTKRSRKAPQHAQPGFTNRGTYKIEVDVNSYTVEELSVKIFSKCVIVEGRHAQRREKFCWAARQFVMKYKVPVDVDLELIKCNLTSDNYLIITAPIRSLAAPSRDIQIQREQVGSDTMGPTDDVLTGPIPMGWPKTPVSMKPKHASNAAVQIEAQMNLNAEASSNTGNRNAGAPPMAENAKLKPQAGKEIPPNNNPA